MVNFDADDSEGEAMPSEDALAYGCVFCRTGQEHRIAGDIERTWPNLCAHAVVYLKRRTTKGVVRLERAILMPGYVFFRAPRSLVPTRPYPDGVLKVLCTDAGRWQLLDRDEAFAQWLFKNDGVIGMSKARRVGDRVQIQSGPLKDLEGMITRVDRRNRSGQVALNVAGREIRVWLGFELLPEEPVELVAQTEPAGEARHEDHR